MSQTNGQHPPEATACGRRLAARHFRARRFFACCLVALACVCALAAFVVSSSGAGAQQQPAPQQPAPTQPPPQQSPAALTPQEQRGKTIYLHGVSPSGREMTAALGEIDVPASTLNCAGCHGARGEGKTEGGVTAGGLTWSHLTKPYGHTHPTGRKHGPFTESAFIRATVNGIDPAGNTLLVAMPRYRMSAEDMADLIAYLKRIETDRDPGLADDSIRVGLLVPAKGALAETGRAIRAVTEAYFAEINAQGGIYNRKIELRVAETGDTPAATAASLERLARDEQVFAVANAFTAGADREITALATRHEVPLIGTFTLLPQVGTPPARQIFHLLPGLDSQARALVNFAAQKSADKNVRAAVVFAQGELTGSVARAVVEQAKKTGWAAPAERAYERGRFDASAVAAGLSRAGAQALFFAGSGGEALSLLAEAEKLGWLPQVYAVGTLVGGEMLNAPAGFKDKIFLSFPTVPSDITPAGESSFRALAAKHTLPQGHIAAQLSAYVGAQLLVEGLKRAGRDLSRERLINALEGLYEFNTGLTPPLTFGPNRRVGASGAYVVAVDLEKKQYAAASGWVSANQ